MKGRIVLSLLALCTFAVSQATYRSSNEGKRTTRPWKRLSANQLESAAECSFTRGRDKETDIDPNVYKAESFAAVAPPALEVRPLVISGDPSNRVDLTFFGDGYLASEKEKFFADALRLAQDMSGNQTFFTVQPLLNFWGAFTPSQESGIGTGGRAKNTVYGLYRPGTELRGVYYSKADVADAACNSLGTQCDYPILLGNDPLYGGLGGRFTVTTSSVDTGAIVLRHELGHSIIGIGEEYDGGASYFGVNSYRSTSTPPVPWAHWLSRPATNPPRVERANMPYQQYIWTLLNTTRPWVTRFTSAGTYQKHLLQVSLSGAPNKTDLKIEIDGKDLDWTPRTDIGVERWFYDYPVASGLAAGSHELKVTLRNKAREGLTQLCNAEVTEYGSEQDFVSTPGYYGLFKTHSQTNATTYRPTNTDCLMRQMTSPNLCKVCVEGLWNSLLSTITVVDNFTRTCEGADKKENVLKLDLLPLAQLRAKPVSTQESYMILWSRNGLLLPGITNQTTLRLGGSNQDILGRYEVAVKFSTSEVRKETGSLFSERVTLDVTSVC